MSICKIIDLSIYHYENVKKIKLLFSQYINIELNKLPYNKLELKFKGKNEEIYCKEFFNYLLIAESRVED